VLVPNAIADFWPLWFLLYFLSDSILYFISVFRTTSNEKAIGFRISYFLNLVSLALLFVAGFVDTFVR
jgi:hypothetical protein